MLNLFRIRNHAVWDSLKANYITCNYIIYNINYGVARYRLLRSAFALLNLHQNINNWKGQPIVIGKGKKVFYLMLQIEEKSYVRYVVHKQMFRNSLPFLSDLYISFRSYTCNSLKRDTGSTWKMLNFFKNNVLCCCFLRTH